jgi:hypothetical protein
MADENYARDRTALLFVDPYNDFLSEGGKFWPMVKGIANDVGLLDNLRTINASVREAGIQVFIARIVAGSPATTRAGIIPARYALHLFGAWRSIHVVCAVIALYLNVFVGIVQAFLKVPALRTIAPTQSEPPFVLTQVVVLAMFVVVAIAAAIRFRNELVQIA